jgi:hypothetical protein
VVGLCERLLGSVCVTYLPVDGDVVGGDLLNRSGPRLECFPGVRDGLQALVLDVDPAGRGVRGVPILGDDCGDRFSLIPRSLAREEVVVGLAQSRHVLSDGDRSGHVGVLQVGPGKDRQNVVAFLDRTGVYVHDFSMCVPAPEHGEMEDVWGVNVVGVLGLAGEVRAVLASWYRRPDCPALVVLT